MSAARAIGLFGGSFNPPHVAHQLVALYVLETCALDEVWFLPAYTHVFGKDLVSFEHRVAMCELAVAALGSRAHVLRTEEELARRPGFVASRTLDLIEHLIAAHPSDAFRLVIGTDILGETHKWHRWDDVVARAPPLVVGRPGFVLPPGVAATGLVMPEVSATRARALLAAADPAIGALVPKSVLAYIDHHNLYK